MPDIRLIATDLDGTLLGDGTSMDTFAAFRKQLATLRARRNVAWVISTGRSLQSFKKVFAPLQMLEIQPDYVIVRHAYIFSIARWGFMPHRIWNLAVRYHAWIDRLNARKEIKRWHGMLALSHRRLKTVEKKPLRLCLQFESESEAESAATLLQKEALDIQHLQVFRYLREVDVRSIPHTKGLAVAELARHLGLDALQVLAIGDGHNDTSMMTPDVSTMCGCPANAAPEVMQHVSRRSGHIASAPALQGVIEILDAFESDRIRSDLPAAWQNPALQANPLPPKPSPRRRSRRLPRRLLTNLALWSLILYTVLVVFASFGLMPFAGRIMQPYRLIEAAATKLFEWWMAR